MGIRRTKHDVYDLKYHLVWIPKYRKNVLSDKVSKHLKGVFQRIAEEYEFKIDTMEVMEDHVHVFVEVPPRYSPAQVVQILKSASAREVFKEFAKLSKQLCAGGFGAMDMHGPFRQAVQMCLPRVKVMVDKIASDSLPEFKKLLYTLAN